MADLSYTEVIDKIKQHKTVVGVVGLGRVGEQVAMLTTSGMFESVGLDTSAERIKHVRKIKSFEATTDKKKLRRCSIFVICVQTPLDSQNKPDYKFLIDACKTISSCLKKEDLVVVESTVAPGTTEGLIAPLLEESGLKAGKDFWLAFCPERLDLGNKRWKVEQIPRVVGGINKGSGLIARAFYQELLDAEVTLLGSPALAEAAKLIENTFRDLNIAFVNELAMCFDRLKIDLSEVIKGASTKPFGYMPFFPGPGVGGDCIPVNPYYLLEKIEEAGPGPKLLRYAREINESMPSYLVERLKDGLKNAGESLEGAEIALLGIAYKANTNDPSNSPSFKIISRLEEEGARLKIFDPLLPAYSNKNSIEDVVEGVKGVIVATPHEEFLKMSPKDLRSKGVKVFVDARNAYNKDAFKREGIVYVGIGRS